MTQAIEDQELFLRTYEAPLIIDEFQYAPALLSYIKIKVDNARQNKMFGNASDVGTMLYGFSTRKLTNYKENTFTPDIKILKYKEKVQNLSTLNLFERIINSSYPEVK